VQYQPVHYLEKGDWPWIFSAAVASQVQYSAVQCRSKAKGSARLGGGTEWDAGKMEGQGTLTKFCLLVHRTSIHTLETHCRSVGGKEETLFFLSHVMSLL
jgi:hypothetical protein